jgi:hypothetical protein
LPRFGKYRRLNLRGTHPQNRARPISLKKDLQTCGAGRKSRKRSTLVMGKKANGEMSD